MTCEAEIVEYARTNDWMSFVEAARIAEKHGIETRGDWVLEPQENLIAWQGSREFIRLMRRLIDEKKLFPHPGSVLAYMADGGMLNLPVAQRLPKGGYKNPHWGVVQLRTIPCDTSKRHTHPLSI